MNTLYPTNTLLDPYDPRDLIMTLGEIPAKNKYPDTLELDFSMIPVLDQKQQGACVGFARASVLAYLFNSVAKLPLELLSESFLYALAKKYDGIPDVDGTYPAILASLNISIGAVPARLFERDASLSKDAYKQLNLTDALKESAKDFKINGYSKIEALENNLVSLLNDHLPLEITLPCDGRWKIKNSIITNGFITGYHRVVVIGYKRTETDTYFKIRNSWSSDWGDKGEAWFSWNEFAGSIHDIYDFIPYSLEVLKIIKDIPSNVSYNFPFTTMKKGSKGESIKQLQNILKLERCLSLTEKVDGVFGPKTEEAVKEFQMKYSLTADGIAGKNTITLLNKAYGGQQGGSSRLDLWALAIQEKEGFFSAGTTSFPNGSRSWRNNNPGNIKAFGKYKTMSMDVDAGGFCIFASYEKGLEALKILLTDASTGVSKVYKPTMTLLDFYNVYSPSSDGNSPATYALYVAKRIGVAVTTQIKELI